MALINLLFGSGKAALSAYRRLSPWRVLCCGCAFSAGAGSKTSWYKD
ncbi:hypothetical protein KCP70_05780 [Salmonella enterica subsp. enterica]|nr:hypothetical protein KCP70_05780 [Salmonella enterica subsp. enterica]